MLEERLRETEELNGLLKPTPETRINLIKNQTHIRTYQVTGSFNYDVSNLILNTICPVIQMRMRVIYSNLSRKGIKSPSIIRHCLPMIPS